MGTVLPPLSEKTCEMDLENSTLLPALENLSIGMASSARFREGGAPDPRETSAKARESQDGGAPIPSPAEKRNVGGRVRSRS